MTDEGAPLAGRLRAGQPVADVLGPPEDAGQHLERLARGVLGVHVQEGDLREAIGRREEVADVVEQGATVGVERLRTRGRGRGGGGPGAERARKAGCMHGGSRG